MITTTVNATLVELCPLSDAQRSALVARYRARLVAQRPAALSRRPGSPYGRLAGAVGVGDPGDYVFPSAPEASDYRAALLVSFLEGAGDGAALLAPAGFSSPSAFVAALSALDRDALLVSLMACNAMTMTADHGDLRLH